MKLLKDSASPPTAFIYGIYGEDATSIRRQVKQVSHARWEKCQLPSPPRTTEPLHPASSRSRGPDAPFFHRTRFLKPGRAWRAPAPPETRPAGDAGALGYSRGSGERASREMLFACSSLTWGAYQQIQGRAPRPLHVGPACIIRTEAWPQKEKTNPEFPRTPSPTEATPAPGRLYRSVLPVGPGGGADAPTRRDAEMDF